MTIWKAEQDPHNPGHWRIISEKTGKTVVYGLSKRDAECFANRRNQQENKRHAKA